MTPPSFWHRTALLLSLVTGLINPTGSLHAEPVLKEGIEFAKVGEQPLQLDLYLPEGKAKSPLIVYVHGGGWRSGSRSDMPLGNLVAQGFPVASVDYRLSTVAPFPAQAHDIKAAIRFLRAKGKELGLSDTSKIVIAGGSAGGHLAAIVGVTNGNKALEGTVGSAQSASSDVQGIISHFGASNLQTILSQSTPHGLKVRVPALELLLGGQPDLARLASPVAQLDSQDTPLLLIHGDADPQMPFAQSEEFQRAYQKAGLSVEFVPVAGGKHGGREFYDEARTKVMVEFLNRVASSPASPTPAKTSKPAPSHADVSYGPHPHQLLDVYLPSSNPSGAPFPVLLWYGGLWKPLKNPPDLNRFLPHQIAVVAVESRTLTDGVEDKTNPPVAYPMEDACRAVQFVRAQASKWGLDPTRIAVGGGSQGALPALYAGCSADRARPDSVDPVERQSSRVTCVAAYRSQPSIDPVRMQEWVPGVMWGAPAFGIGFEESLKRREELLPVIRQWSPEHLLHSGAAPMYFENNWDLTQPATVTEMDYKVHSPAWALGFQKLATQAGATCHVKYPGQETSGYADIWDFLVKSLQRSH
ncbi:alpha/beta hydrolase fold domain-containing protein [Verrucomicrobium sp. BvORR034]|uniref:alpha/beta hydrolase fold domain-containing protein n=1 Tax=Verrucomicrobium sp. BvORR034 TaxID=1396418 RepID=UPI0007C6700F|nr:alpha/beta hydrolase fold domain-containing protein [Verrucomicrobium sp. BvORR034]